MSSNSNRAITFTFGLISLGKYMNSLIPLAMGYHCFASPRMALVLNCPTKFTMLLNKETKPCKRIGEVKFSPWP